MSVEVGFRESALSREDVARIEVGHTTVSPATARALVIVFLVLISVPALVEAIVTIRTPGRTSDAWSALAALPDQARASAAEAGTGAGIFAANRTVLVGLRAFGDALAEESPMFAMLRPPVQSVLSGWLGVGNERVYQGRDGWLFYRPDVEYVVRTGFLEPGEMRRRQQESEREWVDQPQPDPRPALLEFKRQLERRGIALIVMPTPVKPGMHPDKLATDGRWTIPVQNPSYREFIEGLRRERVLVFDVAEQLARQGGAAAYLATDTHWRPETMERTAELLGRFIRTEVPLGESSGQTYRIEAQNVTNLGDTAAMLDLPAGHRLARPETVTMHRVVNADGGAWQPSRSSDVLVLGDSFSNIYSLGSLGWGEGGGLVEHLSRVLERPLDRIVQNDDGAFATRARLRQEIASGSDRLRDKRVVILQFASRELVGGDWKRIELPE